MESIILGVDPGFHVTGYSIVKKTAASAQLIDAGFLKMSPKDSLSDRVKEFYDFFVAKADQHGITGIALETSFLNKNPQTFLKLGYLRGILYLLGAQRNLEIQEFAPSVVKAAVTGFGGATKEQVAIMLCRLFPKLQSYAEGVRHDVTDAIAIGICGAWNLNAINNLKNVERYK